VNILMLISTKFPPEEGIGFHVYNLSNELIKLGHHVTIITRGGFRNKCGDINGINYCCVPFIPIYPLHIQIHKYFVNKYLNVHKNDYDLVHIHYPLTPAPKTNIPMLSTIHSVVLEDHHNSDIRNLKNILSNFFTQIFGKKIFFKIVRQSKTIIAVSDAVKMDIQKYYKDNKINVINNGINISEFHFNDTLIEKTTIFNIIFVGRLSEGKGIFDLLNAINIMKDRGQIRLFICGKGPLKEKINRFIMKNKMETIVRLVGHVQHEELKHLLGQSHLFVSPSYHEGLPTAVMEAMASGTLTLLSDIPSHIELVTDHENGYIFEKGNYFDLSQKLESIMNDYDKINEVRINARKTIEKKYSWERIAIQMVHIYSSTIIH